MARRHIVPAVLSTASHCAPLLARGPSFLPLLSNERLRSARWHGARSHGKQAVPGCRGVKPLSRCFLVVWRRPVFLEMRVFFETVARAGSSGTRLSRKSSEEKLTFLSLSACCVEAPPNQIFRALLVFGFCSNRGKEPPPSSFTRERVLLDRAKEGGLPASEPSPPNERAVPRSS